MPVPKDGPPQVTAEQLQRHGGYNAEEAQVFAERLNRDAKLHAARRAILRERFAAEDRKEEELRPLVDEARSWLVKFEEAARECAHRLGRVARDRAFLNRSRLAAAKGTRTAEEAEEGHWLAFAERLWHESEVALAIESAFSAYAEELALPRGRPENGPAREAARKLHERGLKHAHIAELLEGDGIMTFEGTVSEKGKQVADLLRPPRRRE